MSSNPSSSRPSAPVVAPVEIAGVRYEQDMEAARHGGGGLGGWLVAIDPASGKRLWMLRVYEVPDHSAAGVTGGGRWFKSLQAVPGQAALEIVNEAGGRYRVDLQARTATQVGGPPEQAAPAPPPGKPKP